MTSGIIVDFTGKLYHDGDDESGFDGVMMVVIMLVLMVLTVIA